MVEYSYTSALDLKKQLKRATQYKDEATCRALLGATLSEFNAAAQQTDLAVLQETICLIGEFAASNNASQGFKQETYNILLQQKDRNEGNLYHTHAANSEAIDQVIDGCLHKVQQVLVLK